MTKIDWIIVLVPVIVEGFFLYIFQKSIDKKLDRMGKRDELRDKVLISFWDRMQKVNDALISANIASIRDGNSLERNLLMIRDGVFSTVQFYDTNQYDLKIFEKEYTTWNTSWNDFALTLSQNANSSLTVSMQEQLGKKLQIFKENTGKLIAVIRDKY